MTSHSLDFMPESERDNFNIETEKHLSSTIVYDRVYSEYFDNEESDEHSSDAMVEAVETLSTKGLSNEADVAGKSSRAKTRYFLLQLFNFFTIIFEFMCSITKMINADVNAFIDICFKFFGISQERINKKLLKHLLVVIILVFAFVQSRKDGLQQNFKTQRLFARHSLVADYFKGELSLLRNEIIANEYTLVMFYAPWDRQSQNFVSHFLKAAQYHHEQVTFAAINCWLPKSECKMHFKLHYYPIIVLHVKLSSMDESYVISYNGPLTSHHLIRFVSNALRPFTFIAEETDLLAMQLESQVIVLGYFDSKRNRNEFTSFYLASLSKLQFEHMFDVRYAVITDPVLAEKLSFEKLPSIHLLLWNTTMIYPADVELNIRNITSFVDIHMAEASSWLHISGRKSLTLNKIFQEGPFMVLFTPFNPYHYSNGPYQVMRSVALEYWNCHDIPLQLWLTDHLYLKHKAELRDMDRECRKFLRNRVFDRVIKEMEENDYSNELLKYQKDPTPDMCSIDESNSISHFTWNSVWSSFVESEPMTLDNHCSKTSTPLCRNKNESTNERTSVKQKLTKMEQDHPTVQGPFEDDKIERLLDSTSEEQCKKLALAANLSPPPVIQESKQVVRINGLSCKINRTLRFIAVDSLLHADFAKKIGLDLKNRSHSELSGAVIIDPEMEERYVLDEDLSRNAMAYFVYNFTYNLLNRGKLFTDISSYKSECDLGEVCMQELTSDNYVETISKTKQAYVVLHYSHHCGACSAIGNVMLACQHLTFGVSNIIFARIDISKNTLPWHFTFENVPTIVFHPHDNKSNSRVFNPGLPVTIRNLMSFIISGLKPAERSSLALKLCDSKCKKSVRSQSLLMKLRLHHSLKVLSNKLQRHIALLVELQLNLYKDSSNALLQSKYDLLLTIKSRLINKILAVKSKLSHINNIGEFYPIVPSNFSDQLSFETYTILQNVDIKI